MNRKPLTDKDGEVRELTKEDFATARPATEVVPELVELQKRVRGRPKADKTKLSTTLRLDVEVIEYFKREGRGWQTRLNEALKDYVESHQ